MGNVAKLGVPNRFVKGVADVTIFRYGTGDILATDTVMTEAALSVPMNYEDVPGGFGNSLAGVIPDSLRVTGSISSNAYSLAMRALSLGSDVKEGTSAQLTVKTFKSDGTTGYITVTGAAESPLGHGKIAYVRKSGETEYTGEAYAISNAGVLTLNGASYEFEPNTDYDVFYFVKAYGTESLDIPAIANLKAVSIQIRYGVYEMVDHVKSHGTFAGWLYANIPLAVFETDAGTSGNQTSVSTTTANWTAINPRLNGINILTCENKGALGTYVYVPCDGLANVVKSLALDENYPYDPAKVELSSGRMRFKAYGITAQYPVVFVMDDGDVVTPSDYSVFEYKFTNAEPHYVTIDENGVITSGWDQSLMDDTITASYVKPDGTVLTVSMDVEVNK